MNDEVVFYKPGKAQPGETVLPTDDQIKDMVKDGLFHPGNETILGFVLIPGMRWCPIREDLAEWEEDQEYGCHWCLGNDEPHDPVYRRTMVKSEEIQ